MNRFLPLFLALTFVNSVQADMQPISRYTSVSTEATKAQTDLLEVIVELRFPSEIVTVEHALHYLLAGSGFQLASIEASDPTLPRLLNLSLPRVHRHLGPMTLNTALRTLAGSSWELVEDPVNRLVTFELKQAFAQSGVSQ